MPAKINLKKLEYIDRRIIFLLMAIALVLPFYFPLNLDFKVSPEVQNLYNGLETLKVGDKVLISADYDPASKPELQPFMNAVLRYLFQKKVKVVLSSTWVSAPPLIQATLDNIINEFKQKGVEIKDGIDYTFLGYKSGQQLVILSMAENIRNTFPKNYKGVSINELEIMDGVNNLKDFAIIINISAGSPGTNEWVRLVQARYKLKICSANTAVMAPDLYPYYKAKQLFGISPGMKGSAEFEKLVNRPELATKGMDAQNMAHILIVVSIIFGNVIYFLTKEKKR